MTDPISQLKKFKNNPNLGWVSDSRSEKARESLTQAISSSENTPVVYSASDAIAYHKWMFGDLISKPMVAAVSIFVLLLGGWMTSVNAASSSLPGDTLYSLKLVTESARLKLVSREHRAILHTEFAQRRYEEALAIADTPEKEAYVAQVLEAFHVQINLANSNLQQLQAEEGEDRVKVATEVNQKIDDLNSVIEDAAAQSGDSQDVQQANLVLESTEEVANSAVDVIVDSHEASEENVPQADIDELFKGKYAEIQNREAFDLGRIAVIRQTIEGLELEGEVILPTESDLSTLEFEISKLIDSLSEARTQFALGAVRVGFDSLREINEGLLVIEKELANMEIQVMDASILMQEEIEIARLEEEEKNQKLEDSLEETQ